MTEFHYSPDIIDKMYLDRVDYHGIMYWLDHLEEMEKKINEKK